MHQDQHGLESDPDEVLTKAQAKKAADRKTPSEPHSHDDDEDDEDDEHYTTDEEVSTTKPGGASSAGATSESAREAARRESESAAAMLFGEEYGSLGGYMFGLSGRLKSILSSMKSKNKTIQLSALQEASELLSVSTEDTLAGYFQVDAYVKEFVRIMDGKPPPPSPGLDKPKPASSNTNGRGMGSVESEDDSGGDHEDEDEDEDEEDEDRDDDDDMHGHDDDDEEDEDAALARALAMSAQDAFPSGGGGMVEMGADPSADDLEAQLLACRCLANLMEALPGSAHTVVHHGGVSVLCSKLLEIQYIDLAEQAISVSLDFNFFCMAICIDPF